MKKTFSQTFIKKNNRFVFTARSHRRLELWKIFCFGKKEKESESYARAQVHWAHHDTRFTHALFHSAAHTYAPYFGDWSGKERERVWVNFRQTGEGCYGPTELRSSCCITIPSSAENPKFKKGTQLRMGFHGIICCSCFIFLTRPHHAHHMHPLPHLPAPAMVDDSTNTPT